MADSSAVQQHGLVGSPAAASLPPSLLPAAACLVSVGLSLAAADNADVALLLTWAEKFLGGARPYVDFFEVNPPGSFLIYVPAVILGRALGIPAEHGTRILVLLSIAGSLALVGAALRRPRPAGGGRSVLLACTVVILVGLPARTFAEREHIGVIAILPFLAVVASRMAGAVPSWPLQLAAGMGAALALVAKPHFALALLTLALFLAWRAKSAEPMVKLEWLAGAATALAYLGLSYRAFPAFFSTVIPLTAEIYVPDRIGMTLLLLGPAAMMCFGSGVLLRLRDLRPLPPESLVLAAAAVGSAAAYVVQGKGWPYHSYPAVAFLTLGVAVACAAAMRAGSAQSGRAGGGYAALLLVVAIVVPGWFWFDVENPSRDREALARTVKAAHAEPAIAAITSDIAIAHPIVRMVGGRWVSRSAAQPRGARQLLLGDSLSADRRARLEAYLAAEREALLQDVTVGGANVLLVETGPGEWLAWARLNPKLADELVKFEPFGTVDDVLVMRRR